MRAELDRPEQPTVLVVEDVHWADEATLDVLRFLVRRIVSLPAVLVLTYRDGELVSGHPLQQLLGLAARTPRLAAVDASAPVRRKPSVSSVRTPAWTASKCSRSPPATRSSLLKYLASGDVGGVPHTVAEAVRARLGDLDGPTRDAVERLAVIPSAAERWLVEAVVPGGLASLTLAERRGVLNVSPTRVAFAHELDPPSRRRLHAGRPARRLQPGRPVGAARSP